jgi:hypothetical protein
LAASGGNAERAGWDFLWFAVSILKPPRQIRSILRAFARLTLFNVVHQSKS